MGAALYICRYVADEELRRRVRRQLNKGASLDALRRNLFIAQGHVHRHHLDEQLDQAPCLHEVGPMLAGQHLLMSRDLQLLTDYLAGLFG